MVATQALHTNEAKAEDNIYGFSVHTSTVSQTFCYVMSILYIRLKPLIICPDQEIFQKIMPMNFVLS